MSAIQHVVLMILFIFSRGKKLLLHRMIEPTHVAAAQHKGAAHVTGYCQVEHNGKCGCKNNQAINGIRILKRDLPIDSCSHMYAVRPPNSLLMPANVGPIVAPSAYLTVTVIWLIENKIGTLAGLNI